MALPIVTLLLGAGFAMPVSGDIPTPRQQLDDGVKPSDIQCRDGYDLLLRAGDNSPVCVWITSSSKLIEKGWAKQLVKSAMDMRNLGTVTILQTVERQGDPTKLDSKPRIKGYNVVFQACAGPTKLAAPEVLVISDSETKSVKLSESMNPKACQTSATKITATNVNSIKATLVKKTDIAELVSGLQINLDGLLMQLDAEKKNLAALAKQPQTTETTKQIGQSTDKIIDLRNKVNAARAELQRNMYLLHSSPSKVVDPELYLSLQSQLKEKFVDIEENTENPRIKKISTVKLPTTEKKLDTSPRITSYSYAFQACAGNAPIQFPEVIVASDSETKSVKLGNSLKTGTCQSTSVTIKAGNPGSIAGVLVTSGDKTLIIEDLQAKVSNLQAELETTKKTLAELVKQSPTPEGYKGKVAELTDKIIELRNQLNTARAELHRTQFMIVQ